LDQPRDALPANFRPPLLLLLLAALAICTPAWLIRGSTPSATFTNQAAALMGWALLLASIVPRHVDGHAALRRALPLVSALAVLALCIGLSMAIERLPASLGLSALGMLGATALVVLVAAARVEGPAGTRAAFLAMCAALVVAGLVNAFVALLQTFAPQWIADVDWIASASGSGRAAGNLRQPNHLSSLLLWSMTALVLLHDRWIEAREGHPPSTLHRVVTGVVLAFLVLADVLTVSRTGTVCIVLLGMWGVVDRSLSRYTRVLLWTIPVLYVLCWVGMLEWAQATSQGFSGSVQLHKADPSSSRFGIWANTLSLIRENPWFGVGWGEFNLAWTLSPFPGRPVAFFDHTHNLPLHFLVELGIPAGTLVVGLLLWASWRALVACWRAGPEDRPLLRAAFVMVLMIFVHSMLEYPLWYAYFLLPSAFALGFCLGHSASATPEGATATSVPAGASTWQRVLVGGSVVLFAGALGSVYDYLQVVAIFRSDETTPLNQRIARGQKSVFFAHHADYAAATVAVRPSTEWKAFRRAPHYLLDTRLMIAWSTAYAEKGDLERARYLVERLREFRNPDADEFLGLCEKPLPAGLPRPFQCAPPTREFTYEDFKLR